VPEYWKQYSLVSLYRYNYLVLHHACHVSPSFPRSTSPHLITFVHGKRTVTMEEVKVPHSNVEKIIDSVGL